MTKSKSKIGKTLVKLSFASMLGVLPMEAQAQNIVCADNMIFGEIMPCGSPGTVTVRPDNTTGSFCVSSGPPTSRGRCFITQGFPFRPIQISITSPTFLITNGTANMSVNNFNIITNAGGMSTTVTAPFVSVPVGATLNVGSSQASGTYTGSFGVTAVLQ